MNMEQITVFVEIGDNVKQVLLPIANQSGVEAADAIVRIIKESVQANYKTHETQTATKYPDYKTVHGSIKKTKIPEKIKIEVDVKIPTIYIHHVGLK